MDDAIETVNGAESSSADVSPSKDPAPSNGSPKPLPELPAAKSSTSWMGAFTSKIKTLNVKGTKTNIAAGAGVVVSNVGDILSRPGRKYKEYQEEKEIKVKHCKELYNRLSTSFYLERRGETLDPSDSNTEEGEAESNDDSDNDKPKQPSIGHTAMIVAKADNKLIGGKTDADTIKIVWSRLQPILAEDRVNKYNSNVRYIVQVIKDVTTGYYQPSADDIDCIIRCQVTILPNYFDKSIKITDAKENVFTTQIKNCLVIDDTIKQDIDAKMQSSVDDGQIIFENLTLASDPLHKVSLVFKTTTVKTESNDTFSGLSVELIRFADKTNGLSKTIKEQEVEDDDQQHESNGNTEEDDDDATDSGDDLLDDDEVLTSNSLLFRCSFPMEAIQLKLNPNDNRRFTIMCSDISSTMLIHSKAITKSKSKTSNSYVELSLSVASSDVRDIITMCFRKLRAEIYKSSVVQYNQQNGTTTKDILPIHYDYLTLESANKPLIAFQPERVDDNVDVSESEYSTDEEVEYENHPCKVSSNFHCTPLIEEAAVRAIQKSVLGDHVDNNMYTGVFKQLNYRNSIDNTDSQLCACDCMYPEVFDYLNVLPMDVKKLDDIQHSKSISHQKANSLPNSQYRKFGFASAFIDRVIKPRSESFDDNTEKADYSAERKMSYSLLPKWAINNKTSTNSLNGLESTTDHSTDMDRETDFDEGNNTRSNTPVSTAVIPDPFDLYVCGNFAKNYDVIIMLDEGEGLGITLGVKYITSDFPGMETTPTGACVIIITGFCPIANPTVPKEEQQDHEKIKGQLELNGRIRIGDALVAINGVPVEPPTESLDQNHLNDTVSLKEMSSADVDTSTHSAGTKSTYHPCSLARVAKLVNSARTNSMDNLANDSEKSSSKIKLINSKCELKLSFAEYNYNSPVSSNSSNNVNLLPRDEHKRIMTATKAKIKQNHTKELKNQNRLFEQQVIKINKQWGKKLKANELRLNHICELLEVHQGAANSAAYELEMMTAERNDLKDEIQVLKHQLKQAQEEIDSEKANLSVMYSQLQGAKKEIATLQQSMASLASDGQAWVNKLGTNEQALQAMQTDLRAAVMAKEQVEELLDNSRKERDMFKEDAEAKKKIIEELEDKYKALDNQCLEANDEADALTARIRQISEEYEENIRRCKHDIKLRDDSIQEYTTKIRATETHHAALREAIKTAEENADVAATARQQAEMRCNKAIKDNMQAVADVEAAKRRVAEVEDILQGRLDEEAKVKARDEELQGALNAAAEAKRNALKVQAENDELKTQNNSLKTKNKSLAHEVSKMAKADALADENNDLMVQLQLEKAQRMEAEDELSAYKRALRQFGEQAKRDEKDGNGSQWNNRPKLFDHLFKTLLAEEAANNNSQQKRRSSGSVPRRNSSKPAHPPYQRQQRSGSSSRSNFGPKLDL